MLKGQDIVVLSKLLLAPGEWTVRGLEQELSIPRSVIHRSLRRLADARLFDRERGRASSGAAEEFLMHALHYVFPVVQLGEVRGIPTAWAAQPLVGELAPQRGLPPVWPDAIGKVRGLGIEPLHPAAPLIAVADPPLAEFLALIDSIRLGDARIRDLARRHLQKRIEAGERTG